ncbi:uncharacterized protein RAG0_08596 [Rhynchosporium agropyri]|uniref:Uncharacterized protein n=1 Tax=Rhynchosporium agropyri TaxID=914238 RepID=A0A1E1KRJ0_9HELO|nr:uncharacterized protein RAG0_08596 [Rhynchosporium agropyri]
MKFSIATAALLITMATSAVACVQGTAGKGSGCGSSACICPGGTV